MTGVRPRTARRSYARALRGEGVATAPAAVDRSLSRMGMFRRVVVDVASARAQAHAGTHTYRFSWPSPVQGGAIHCLDVPFLWDALDEVHVPHPQTLHDLQASFF